MSSLSEFTGPGYLWIQSQPNSGCVDEVNPWFESEHGPLRLKLDSCLNGYQYRSTEDPSIYLATYDLKKFEGPRYTSMRENRSPREQELIDSKLNLLDHRIYTDLSTRGHVEGAAPVMMSVAFVVKDEHLDELHRWYEEEHTSDLMQIPGWLRSRRFQLIEAAGQKPGFTELLAVHEFASDNGLDGKEHQLAKSKPWRNRVLSLVSSRKNQRYEFVHEFNINTPKQPFEAISINDLPDIPNGIPKASYPWTGGPGSHHLDGSSDPAAPVVIFSNSLLIDLHIWDTTVSELSKLYPYFRFLRYNTRGFETSAKATIKIHLLTDELTASLVTCMLIKCTPSLASPLAASRRSIS